MIGNITAVPAFKYVSTGQRVPEKDFSTLNKLFSDKKAVLEFLDLWCSGEIVRDIFLEGIPSLDLSNADAFNDVVGVVVGEYHARYGLVPHTLARQDLDEAEVAVVRIGDDKFYPPVNEFSCHVPLRTSGSQGDQFMSAVRSAVLGHVVRDNEVLLFLLNQTESEVGEVSPDTCVGSFPMNLFVKAHIPVWENSIAVPAVVTTPHVLREFYREEGVMFLERPTELTGTKFGALSGGVDILAVEPSGDNYVLGCENIDKGACYALGSPSVLGVRHVQIPLQVTTAQSDGLEILFLYAYLGAWLQSKAVGKSRAVP